MKNSKCLFPGHGLAVLALLLVGMAGARGQVYNVLHQFGAVDLATGTNYDGADPQGGVAQGADGSIYGTTEEGGANARGVIFKITPQGQYVLVHTFSNFVSGTNDDGAYPEGTPIAGPDGSIYGITAGGGIHGNYGVIYKVGTDDSYTVLHYFDYTQGENPIAPLIFGQDGNIYGEAVLGGSSGSGTIFEYSSNGTFQTLYSFTRLTTNQAGIYTNLDGARPYGITQGRDGNLYGTSIYGGTNGNGTVYQFTTNGVFNLLHAFSAESTNYLNLDGASPQAPLTEGFDGGFYGTAQYGGTNGGGTIFRVTADGQFSVVHTMNYLVEGRAPSAPLLLVNGQFLTTTDGSGDNGSGAGCIFQVTTSGAVTVFHTFGLSASDGAYTQSGLTLARDGSFYGVTLAGGTNGTGAVYLFSLPRLSITRNGQQSILAWPTNQTGFSLQLTTTLGSGWTPATPTPVVAGAQYVVTNPASGPSAFYQLVK